MTSMEDAFKKAGFKPKQQERQDRGGGRSRRPKEDLPKFPGSYFEIDEQGNRCLQTVFISRKNVDPLARLFSNANPKLTTGQMRRFFNHCRDIERRLKVDGETWGQVAADFESLSAHAQYAGSGQNKKIPHEFRRFIDRNVESVASDENQCEAFLKGFMPHFEALVGFGAAYMRDR